MLWPPPSAAFSIRQTLNPWWGWRTDLSVPVSLNETECKTFPPWAAYNPPLSAIQLSKRNKGLVCPSSTSHTASSLEAKQTLCILRYSNTPRAHLTELWWQKCPISTITTVQNCGFYFIWLYLHRDSGGYILGSAAYMSVPLHSAVFAFMITGKVHRTRGWWRKPGEKAFPEQNKGSFRKVYEVLYALLLKEQRELLLNNL